MRQPIFCRLEFTLICTILSSAIALLVSCCWRNELGLQSEKLCGAFGNLIPWGSELWKGCLVLNDKEEPGGVWTGQC